ncbi:MAG: hypothetical protein LBP72_00485 [Dysgonamonadaceae bacterium]|jgi:hypothetical protein|nr:hypothetical protein [Dysgonamonadaceae bacterium]
MDKLSDYIPLIIIIGSIIYSAIKGGSKKKQEEMAKTTLPGKRFDETVRSEKNAVKKQTLPKPKVASTEKKEIFHKAAKVIPNVETHLVEEQEYVKPLLDIEDHEEVRRAFIYAEILNRKNY